jgi:AcrR family transcriptional regulator
MAQYGSFHETVRTLLRDRLLDATADLVVARGWAQLRMGEVADIVGVSRQTLYNELGTKSDLAEALVGREVQAFLAGVGAELEAHSGNLHDALVAAIEFCLKKGADNALLAAVVGSDDTGLLPLLTTRSADLSDASAAVILDWVEKYWPDLATDQVERRIAVDTLIRVVLSHMVRPSDDDPEVTASHLAWFVERAIAGSVS